MHLNGGGRGVEGGGSLIILGNFFWKVKCVKWWWVSGIPRKKMFILGEGVTHLVEKSLKLEKNAWVGVFSGFFKKN